MVGFQPEASRRIQSVKIDRIAAFSQLPDKGLIAINGKWDEALSFDIGNMPDDRITSKYINDCTDVAFEAFFGNCFFGLRCSNSFSTSEFVEICLASFESCNNGQDQLQQLGKALIGAEFGKSFDFAELGAEGIWNTLGGIKLQLDRHGALSDASWSDITSSAVYQNTTNVKAVEFACGGPFSHWIALPVSEDKAPYRVERRMIEDALRYLGDNRET